VSEPPAGSSGSMAEGSSPMADLMADIIAD
jgi:hypothetical protein